MRRVTYFYDTQCLTADRETYIATTKKQAVNPVRVVVILRPRIFRKQFPESIQLPCLEQSPGIRRELHSQLAPAIAVGKAAAYAGMAVSIFYIRLDIEYRCAVCKISPEDINDPGGAIHGRYLHRTQPQRVRAERGA